MVRGGELMEQLYKISAYCVALVKRETSMLWIIRKGKENILVLQHFYINLCCRIRNICWPPWETICWARQSFGGMKQRSSCVLRAVIMVQFLLIFERVTGYLKKTITFITKRPQRQISIDHWHTQLIYINFSSANNCVIVEDTSCEFYWQSQQILLLV